MDHILYLQRELQEASAAMARAERVALQYPDRPSVLATLETIQVRRHNLEQQFIAAAETAGLELCSYRVEYEPGRRPTLSGLTSALSNFQKIFTTVYDALRSGVVKKRARISDEIEELTSFGFAYTFPGSVGFMLTLPAERVLIGASFLDEAMTKTLSLLSPQSSEGVQIMAETVGLPAVRLAHQWALENSKAGFGADIQWKGTQDASRTARIQPSEIRTLANTLGAAIAKETIVVVGELTHVNYTERQFDMTTDEKTISGSFDKAISENKPAQIPRRYRATLQISTRVALLDDKEQVDYFLLSLEDLSPRGSLLSSG